MKNFRPTVRRLAKFVGKEDRLNEDELKRLEDWCSFESMKNNDKVNYRWLTDYGFTDKHFQLLRKGLSINNSFLNSSRRILF